MLCCVAKDIKVSANNVPVKPLDNRQKIFNLIETLPPNGMTLDGALLQYKKMYGHTLDPSAHGKYATNQVFRMFPDLCRVERKDKELRILPHNSELNIHDTQQELNAGDPRKSDVSSDDPHKSEVNSDDPHKSEVMFK